jgi:hypothetical protein
MTKPLIVALPAQAGYALCVPWLAATKPGDVGGGSQPCAAVWMAHDIYPTQEAAQAAWRKRMGM